MHNETIARLIWQGASALFKQHEHSNGYLSLGDSSIAEANLVIHVAAPFIREEHAVWAESPFTEEPGGNSKHMDLVIDLEPDLTENLNVLLIEAKRIAPHEENTKLLEIIRDYDRIRTWPARATDCRPLFFGTDLQLESARGALVVLLANEDASDRSPSLESSFSNWWKHLNGFPSNYSGDLLMVLASALQKASMRGVEYASYRDGGIRLAVLWAIFQFRARDEALLLAATHEASHAVIGWRIGAPVRFLSIQKCQRENGAILEGQTICDWESLRPSLGDQEVCRNAYAIAYAGIACEMQLTGQNFEAVYKDGSTDSDAVLKARSLQMEWQHLSAIADTFETSKRGFQLASSLVQEELKRIRRLADHLYSRLELHEPQIQEWFEQDRKREAVVERPHFEN